MLLQVLLGWKVVKVQETLADAHGHDHLDGLRLPLGLEAPVMVPNSVRLPFASYLAGSKPVPSLPGLAHGEASVGMLNHPAPLPQPILVVRPFEPVLQQEGAVLLPAQQAEVL